MFQPLNVFQRLMRAWDRIHPYNAAQCAVLDPSIEPDELINAFPRAVTAAGLGEVRVGHDAATMVQVPANDPRLQPATTWIGGSFEHHVSTHMNQPFAPDREVPFRAFVVRDGTGCRAGLVYSHWVADSWSIRRLIQRWIELAMHRSPSAPMLPLPGGYWKLVGPNRLGWTLSRGLLDALRHSSRLRSVRRTPTNAPDAQSVAFQLHALPDGIGPAMRHRARLLGATVNDVMLAAAAQSLARCTTNQKTRRRPDLSMGTIVDLRRSTQLTDRHFGLLLGFVGAVYRPADLNDFGRLLEQTARQSSRSRLEHAAAASMVRLAIGCFLSERWPARKLLEFYRKRLPLAGGISNVEMSRDPLSSLHPSPLRDYIRVSPAGPMMPLAFTPTTLGNQSHIGFTYKPGAMDEQSANALLGTFADRLCRFAFD